MSTSPLPHLPLIINNAPHNDPTANTGTHYSASLSRPYCTYTSATPLSALLAADSSWTAFQTWRNTLPRERRAILLRTANLLREHEQELSKIYIEETNCPPEWASKNIQGAVAHMQEMASRITHVLTGELPVVQTPGLAAALVYKVPIGPVLGIPPWNAGIWLASKVLVTPLAVGCTVVLKVSEQCVRTQHFLVDLFVKAGVPGGVINVLQCVREDAAGVTEALIGHRAIRKVEFIGSAGVGRVIGALAGRYLKPVLMELGGKAPLIVCEDADLEAAAKACVLGGYLHHGQICFSTERVIVRREVQERFVEVLKQVAGMWQSQGGAIGTEGPARTVRLVKQAVEKGAEVVFGDGELMSQAKMGPVILRGVPKDATISDEEAFGPVLALYTVDSDEEAIELANDTQYGLGAGIYSTDILRAMKIARQLEVAGANINLPIGCGHDEGELALRPTEVIGLTIAQTLYRMHSAKAVASVGRTGIWALRSSCSPER